MAVDPAPEAPQSEGRQQALRALAGAVARRDLQAPALFLLEVVRPLHLLIQQALYVAHPLLRPWIGDRALQCADLLGDAEALDQARDLLARRHD